MLQIPAGVPLKWQKHAAVIQVARIKLNTVHQHVYKVMNDSKILDIEFTHISDETECCLTMKEEI